LVDPFGGVAIFVIVNPGATVGFAGAAADALPGTSREPVAIAGRSTEATSRAVRIGPWRCRRASDTLTPRG